MTVEVERGQDRLLSSEFSMPRLFTFGVIAFWLGSLACLAWSHFAPESSQFRRVSPRLVFDAFFRSEESATLRLLDSQEKDWGVVNLTPNMAEDGDSADLRFTARILLPDGVPVVLGERLFVRGSVALSPERAIRDYRITLKAMGQAWEATLSGAVGGEVRLKLENDGRILFDGTQQQLLALGSLLGGGAALSEAASHQDLRAVIRKVVGARVPSYVLEAGLNLVDAEESLAEKVQLTARKATLQVGRQQVDGYVVDFGFHGFDELIAEMRFSEAGEIIQVLSGYGLRGDSDLLPRGF